MSESVRSPSAPEASIGCTATPPEPKSALSSHRPPGWTDRWQVCAPPVARLPSTFRSDSRTAVTAPASRSFAAYSVRPSGCTARYDGSGTPVIVPRPVIRPEPGSYEATPMPFPPPSAEV